MGSEVNCICGASPITGTRYLLSQYLLRTSTKLGCLAVNLSPWKILVLNGFDVLEVGMRGTQRKGVQFVELPRIERSLWNSKKGRLNRWLLMQRPGINKSSNEVSVGVAQQCFCELGISSEVQFNNREGCPSNSLIVSRTGTCLWFVGESGLRNWKGAYD